MSETTAGNLPADESKAAAKTGTDADHGGNDKHRASTDITDESEPQISFQVPPQRAPTVWKPETLLTLAEFRGLMGIPFNNKDDYGEPSKDPDRGPVYPLAAPINRPHSMPSLFRRIFVREDVEAPTSIYYGLLTEERRVRHRLRYYNCVIYGGLISQLILAAALIILGARGSTDGIAIATIGAVQGVIAGVLSILKGQGMPVRLIRYVDQLRRVRNDIEFHERQLRMKLKMVTLADAIALRDNYEEAREAAITNHPDVWQTGQSGGTNASVDQKNINAILAALNFGNVTPSKNKPGPSAKAGG